MPNGQKVKCPVCDCEFEIGATVASISSHSPEPPAAAPAAPVADVVADVVPVAAISNPTPAVIRPRVGKYHKPRNAEGQ